MRGKRRGRTSTSACCASTAARSTLDDCASWISAATGSAVPSSMEESVSSPESPPAFWFTCSSADGVYTGAANSAYSRPMRKIAPATPATSHRASNRMSASSASEISSEGPSSGVGWRVGSVRRRHGCTRILVSYSVCTVGRICEITRFQVESPVVAT